MEAGSRRNGALISLNAAVITLDLARDKTNLEAAKDAFNSTSTLLATIRVHFLLVQVNPCFPIADRCAQDSMIKEVDFVELGLACAGVCQVLDQVIAGGRQEQPSQSILGVIEQLKA